MIDVSRVEEAMQILEEIAAVHTKILGNEDDYLRARNAMGICLADMGKTTEALAIFKEVGQIRKRKLGEKHPSYLSARNDEATCMFDSGNYEEALKIFTEIDFIYMEKPSKYPSHHTTKLNLSACLIHLKRFEEALPFLEEIELAHKKKFGGNKHPDLLKIKHYIGLCWKHLGRRAEGDKLLEIANRLGGPSWEG